MATAQLLSHPINITYLTGFKSSNAYLLKTPRKIYLFTDGRYLQKAQSIKGVKVIDLGRNFKESWHKIIKKHNIETITFESKHLTVKQLKHFKTLTKGIKWIEGNEEIEQLRAKKEPYEIRKLKQSQAINEQVFYSVKKLLRPGITELEIANHIKRLALEFGAEDISFEPIIGFRDHPSMPHHQNTSRKLKKGDMVLIDVGVSYQGYASDMTRTLFTKSPTPKQEKIYNIVLEAQEAAIQHMKPNISCAKLDKIARTIIDKAGYEDSFIHSLGHGIGLEVHEIPTLSQRSPHKLKAGMVITSEPGIYLPNKLGVRIEDMILITQKGHRNLTKVPKAIKDCILR